MTKSRLTTFFLGNFFAVVLALVSLVVPITVSAQNFDDFNPLKIGQPEDILNKTGSSAKAAQFSTPAGILNEALKFLFPAAGLILFVMIIWGGFEMVMNASSSKGQDAGKQRITAAIIGFLLLFVSYWLVQIVEAVFGVKILGQ